MTPVVEPVDAADALDERRLAGAVVAEQGEDLARVDLEVHVLERQDRAEALGRPADGDRRARSLDDGHARAAWSDPETPLEVATQDVRLDGEDDDHADDDELEERVDGEQVHAVADDPDHQRPDERVARRCPVRRGSSRRR